MITTLHIKNIGIIEDITINLNQGLNVLTGETGAGKTLIIDSLCMIAGGRFSKEMIRKGEECSLVEAELYLPNEEEMEGNFVVSREVYANGRNSCKINGRLVTVNELKLFMANILNIHGQNDNQNLLNKEMHIQYLDKFIGERIFNIRNEYKKIFDHYNYIKTELVNNYGDEKEKQRKLDLLYYQRNEIEDAKLKTGEEENLEEQRKQMLNSEKVSENLLQADTQIGENALDAIGISIKGLEKIEDIHEKYGKTLNCLKSIYYDLQEISRDIMDYKEELYFDESERAEIENRLDLIYSLKRKYGNTIEEILQYKDEINKEIERIENLEEYTNKLKEELKQDEAIMTSLSDKMDKIRKEYALTLSNKINAELKDLEMKSAEFYIQVEADRRVEFNKYGKNGVEFMIATNAGEDKKPLIKIASGGEMSRIMLAIKTVLSDVDEVPILVFDEIDTGISGKAAKAVGEKLTKIAKKHQILIVTHLASIAAKGNFNYYIYKETVEGKTKTNIKQLKEEEIVREIARIASGDITEISLKHAMELREAI
ncbi:MAG TPA: DNA repair protein RecN [Candidatus Merdicola faecigallinarum]|uniref:DNA repair protein RecN n=1 Tax=Candidatus Merdicola faecigallinarum TaxID=2840862 RepID=A0A9D1M1Z4_9FIRM|nr:DNA repair protein RecN [Candidatus Merdicola faecigallinarum]